MILIGLGSNMTGPWGAPRPTLERALDALSQGATQLVSCSEIVMTEPWGKADQPRYANAVAHIATRLEPLALLQLLRSLERQAGRKRREKWGARTLDLDILDYNGVCLNAGLENSDDARLVLPHPAMHERAFILEPVAEIAPNWRHPVLGKTAREMLDDLARDGR